MEDTKVKVLEDLQAVIPEEPTMGGAEVTNEWEMDMMLEAMLSEGEMEAMIFEEEKKDRSGLPRWVQQMF